MPLEAPSDATTPAGQLDLPNQPTSNQRKVPDRLSHLEFILPSRPLHPLLLNLTYELSLTVHSFPEVEQAKHTHCKAVLGRVFPARCMNPASSYRIRLYRC